MSTFLPTYSDPTDAIITAAVDLLRNGPGGGIPSPSWPEGDPCPADHWLLPAGTTLYRYDQPDQALPPAVLVGQFESAQRRYDHDARFWDVPLYIGIIWSRITSQQTAEAIRRRLERLFFRGVQDGSAEISILTLLSNDDVQCHFVKTASVDRLTMQDNRPMFEVNITLFASGRHTPAP